MKLSVLHVTNVILEEWGRKNNWIIFHEHRKILNAFLIPEILIWKQPGHLFLTLTLFFKKVI